MPPQRHVTNNRVYKRKPTLKGRRKAVTTARKFTNKGCGGRAPAVSVVHPSRYSESKDGHYTYQLNLQYGRKYVGFTSNLKRIDDHSNGEGAAWTRKYAPKSIAYIHKHKSEAAARSAETREYYAAKAKYGDKVRGAGHTTSHE